MPSPSTTLIAAASGLVAHPTSGVARPQANQSSKPSRTTIALLATVGSLVVIVFTGCFIFSQVKNYRARRAKHLSKTSASLSFNLLTGGGTQTSAREANTTFSNGLEENWLPQPRPQQTREMSVKDEEPRYRFVSHPYQVTNSTSSFPTDPANQTQYDMRSLALALPVSSRAPGARGSVSSRLTFFGHTARGSQSSSGHARSDSAGKSDDATVPSSRPSLKISTPPVQNHASNPKSSEKLYPPERKYSKSFLVFDDDSPISGSQAVFKLPPSLPATPEYVPNEVSDPGRGPAPKMMTVTTSYTPRLRDELSLKMGDIVKLVREYDDGWCVVEQVGTANVRSGAVPKMCLHERAST
ncbi:hypothetical protein APHAL10511_000897 [Amanita phalloides]|nr:hypothetical protein APHAL10511_000897 [Amanita phalloides]